MIYIFDKDGTLTKTKSGKPCSSSPKDYVLLPGVENKLRMIADQGDRIFVCSNQGGVAMGYMTSKQVKNIMSFFHYRLPMIEKIYYTCSHVNKPIKGSMRPKPYPDMIFKIQDDNNDWCTDNYIFIGDSLTDMTAAINSNIPFVWAHEFFGWNRINVIKTSRGYEYVSGREKKLNYIKRIRMVRTSEPISMEAPSDQHTKKIRVL